VTMSERQIENGLIESTMLGMEDHGIFTCYLHLAFDGTGQGFGGYGLDAPVKENGEFKGRVGSAYGMDFIMEVCRVVGVEKWEDLKGKHIRADHDWGTIYRIGHIRKNLWFDPAELYERHKNTLDAMERAK